MKLKTRAVFLSALLLGSSLVAPAEPLRLASAALAASRSGKAAADTNSAGLGLDEKTVAFINRGQWQEAAARLETLTQGQPAASRERAWLAFAYLFLGKCSECRALADKAQAEAAEAGKVPARLMESFSQACAGKLDDARKTLESLPDTAHKDPLFHFALAAVAGKQGRAAEAIAHTKTTVGLAPGFGWGHRTLGYLQARWLKNQEEAEAALRQALAQAPDFKEARDLLVDTLLVRNKFDEAIDAARDGIKARPRDAESYYRLAQIYIQQWRLREASEQLRKAMSLASAEPKYHRSLASILRYQGNLNEAVAEQQKAVDLSKDKAFDLVELASLNMLAGNSNRAADNLQEALRLEPDNQAAFEKLVALLDQEKRHDELVLQYRAAVERKPDDAALHLGLAQALRRLDKTDEAKKALVKAANLSPTDPEPHRRLGVIHLEEKDYGAAAKEYTRALSINPNPQDLVALGYAYAQNQDYVQAETAFVTAIALQQLTQISGGKAESSLMDVMRSLAVLFLTEGRYPEAATQLEAICASAKAEEYDRFLLAQAKALRDRTDSASADMVAVYDKLPDADKKKARSALVDSLLKLDRAGEALSLIDKLDAPEKDTNVDWLVLRSRAVRLQGKPDLARELASRAVSTKEEDASKQSEAYLELGLAELAREDIAAAETNIRKAIELNPKSFTAYEASARVYMKKGEHQNAAEAAGKALEINPYHAPAYLLAGDAQAAAGKMQEALTQYKKATEVYPGLLPAHKSLLRAYEKLSLKEEARQEAEQIAQIENRE